MVTTPPVTPDARWFDALDAVGAHTGDPAATFAALAQRHAGPGRHYHDFEHAQLVVDHVLALHQPGDDWATAALAAWYHDAVYDPTLPPGASEGASAVVAVADLTTLGVAHTAVGGVARLVCVTAGHRPAAGDGTGALLCDADLSILGAESDVYDRYVADVRREYAHVSDDDWWRGRRTVLRGFLDRATIFHTIAGRAAWEAPARTNISRELESLD